MTAPDFERAARAAEEFAAALRTTTEDAGGVRALYALGTLTEALSGVETVLRVRYRQMLAEAIQRAAGNATTHRWTVHDDFALITCSVCGCRPGGEELARGQVPVCSPDPVCQHSIYGRGEHDELGARHHGLCIFCDDVFPSTADPESGVAR